MCHLPGVMISRVSDVARGGRWCHAHCIPGGVRSDDTLETESETTLEMVAMIQQQLSRNRLAEVAEVSEEDTSVAKASEETIQTVQNALRSISPGGSLQEPSCESLNVHLQESSDIREETVWTKALKASPGVISDLTSNVHPT